MRHLPLSNERILAWADLHFERNGCWPNVQSGLIFGGWGETWRNVNNALRYGFRGLPGGSSLALFLAEHRQARTRANIPPLSLELIVKWVKAHHRRTGRWPHLGSGAVITALGETWAGINWALQNGTRGLPGGTTLGCLVAERFGVRNHTNIPILSAEQILIWADRFFRRAGDWPNHLSGPIRESPADTWGAVHQALVHGLRGLPGGSSLYKFLKEHRQIAGPRPPVRQKLPRRGQRGRSVVRLNLPDDTITRYQHGQLTVGDIAEEFNVSEVIARRALTDRGIEIRGGRRPGVRPAEHRTVIRLYRGGFSLKAIGSRMELSAGRVCTILKQYGIARRPAGPAYFAFDMSQKDRERFAAKLRELRAGRGFSQDQLSAQCGIPQATLSALENARSSPTRQTVSKLATALRVRRSVFVPSGQD